MATKKNEAATVTRIKAGGNTSKKKSEKTTKSVATVSTPAKKTRRKSVLWPLAAIGGYFKGAWIELRQVRWPTRGATWSLTGAVLLFTAFFVVLVLLLDALFKYVFELIIG